MLRLDENTDANEIIVTAQKKAENLQDVPIAVSAFSQDTLEKRGLNGGADLQNAIPNVTFGATGFGRYNFQIRGIGAQILGAAADTGVGIHENNIPLTVNRLAQAEFYDVERVEVLRGPQGHAVWPQCHGRRRQHDYGHAQGQLLRRNHRRIRPLQSRQADRLRQCSAERHASPSASRA